MKLNFLIRRKLLIFRSHLDYLAYFFKHKYYYFLIARHFKVSVGRRLFLNLDLLTLPKIKIMGDFYLYIRMGKVDKKLNAQVKELLNEHYASNENHWQHWLHNNVPIAIPKHLVEEMVCDWWASCMANGNQDVWRWYRFNRYSITLHPKTVQVTADSLLTLHKILNTNGRLSDQGIFSSTLAHRLNRKRPVEE